MKINYKVQGDGEHIPVIMLHGLAGDSRFFYKQLNFFSGFCKTVIPDLPGHGKSPFIENPSLDLYSACIDKITEKEKIREYVLAGHSMGALVCINNYLQHNDRVKALILISSAPVLPVTENMVRESYLDFYSFYMDLVTKIFHKKGGIFAISARNNLSDDDKKTIRKDMELCSGLNYNDLLKKIRIPVLLIANKYDEVVPVYLTEDMHRKITNSKFIVFNNKGHVPFFENSEEFNKTVYEFIASLQLK